MALHLCETLALGGAGPVVAIKDVIDVAGRPTRAGSRALADAAPASRHAAVVEALLAADCRIVGKLRMHELAFGVTGINAWAGTPPNPDFPDFVPGGSSSGSATVVAAGLVDFSLGTDTGGSIRIPAACCGVVGLKPSVGRLSRRGLTPAESSLDCVGPLGRSVAAIVQAMAILDPAFVPAAAPGRLRLGWVECGASPRVGAQVRSALDSCLDACGAAIVPVSLPDLDAAYEAGLTIMNAEMARSFGHLLESGRLGADIEARLRHSLSIQPEQVAAAETVRLRFRAEVDRALAGCDALALPTLPDLPLTVDRADDAMAARESTRLVRPFNLSGHPALSLPVRGEAAGPVGLQLVGPMNGDAELCAVAARIEAALRDAHAGSEP
ncbi:amidase [Methylobacterium nonmethylotrophicum]|uniref:Indoleacetamide hydrolase n=1 Tax=Methylobacterium nonmethylotrophicum TaxID=1141884 RepID=A0A4Z0NFW6_9HYPH|nr:amidase [Methylobacterium nonmethylotrophicum]